jgi:glycosyltransferase involved in cell wall biosynthesis
MADRTRPTIVLVQTQAENAGAQEIARLLGHSLSAKGFDIYYSFFFRRTASFKMIGNVHFAYHRKPARISEAAKMASALFRHLRAVKPDAVITFQHFGNILGAPIARAAGVRCVLANLNTARDQLPRWIVATEWVMAASGIYSTVIANSANTAAEFRRLRRLIRIDHGFEPRVSDKSKTDARAALQLPLDVVLLGSVGRLHRQKNHAAIIALLPHNPTWHAAIAGQGELLPELRAMGHQLGCQDRLHFVGELPPEEIGAFLKALDVFVFTSQAETFGLAAVEAAQSGVPVVCHDLDVMREVLEVNGEPCARFVDVNDHVAFAAAIREALPANAGGVESFVLAPLLREKYSLRRMVDGYVRALANAGIGNGTVP